MIVGWRQHSGRVRAELLVFGCLLAVAAQPVSVAADEPLSLALTAFVDGIVAFNQGGYETARQHFEEAVRLRPGDGTARFWLGVADLKLGQPGRALEQLEASLKAASPPRVDPLESLSDSDRAMLKAADSKTWSKMRQRLEKLNRRHRVTGPAARREAAPGLGADFLSSGDLKRWTGSIGLTLGADSNPNLLDDELILPTSLGKPVSGMDSDSLAAFDFGLEVYPFRGLGRTLGLKLDGRQTLHQDFGELDTNTLRGIIQLAWGRDPMGFVAGPLSSARVPFGNSPTSLLLQLGFERADLDGASYLEIITTAASLTLRETITTATRIDLSLEDRDYGQIAALPLAGERSGERLRLAASQSFFFRRQDRFLRLGAFIGSTDAGAAFDASFHGAGTEVGLPLGRWFLLLGGSVRKDDYDDPASNLFAFGTEVEPRDDTTWQASAALEWALNRKLRLLARVSHVDRDSNAELGAGQPSLGYSRTVTSVGWHWSLR